MAARGHHLQHAHRLYFLLLGVCQDCAHRAGRCFIAVEPDDTVVGVFSGMVLLDEKPHWQDFAALVLVLAALATVMLPPRRKS